MGTQETIEQFLKPKKIIITGVSRNERKFGYLVYQDLLKKGFSICPVNPNTEKINEHKCYSSIEEVPEGYDRLLSLSPSATIEEMISLAEKKGIKYIWFQQKDIKPELIKKIENKGITVIYKKCIFMFSEPVEGGHKFHRGLAKLFGVYPKYEKNKN